VTHDNPFHVDRWPAAILHPDEYRPAEYLALAWDPEAQTSARQKKLLDEWIARLPSFTDVRHLRIPWQVNQPLFDAACRMRDLRTLRIKWSSIRSLERITDLASLQALSLGSSTKIESIEPLATLSSLQVLGLENLRRISDFSPLARLTGLRSLSVTGSMWSRQTVDSLKPFARMTWLESLSVDTAHIRSLRPLARLRGLKTLHLGGRLPYTEYAWLAAKLPDTECQWFAPYLSLSFGPCPRCKSGTRVMVTGRGKPVLCRACDAEKLAKHVAMFELARSAARDEAFPLEQAG
jgi:hypothetical protein